MKTKKVLSLVTALCSCLLISVYATAPTTENETLELVSLNCLTGEETVSTFYSTYNNSFSTNSTAAYKPNANMRDLEISPNVIIGEDNRLVADVYSYPHSTALCLYSATVLSEENTNPDVLEIYKHKFELLNEKYGTDFQIATFNMTETELNDLLTDYLNMTDEEFEAYFIDMKEKSDDFLQRQSENHVIVYSVKDSCSFDDMLLEDGNISICKNLVEYPQDIKDTSYNIEKNTMENAETPYSWLE